jgi:hypothetical protein
VCCAVALAGPGEHLSLDPAVVCRGDRLRFEEAREALEARTEADIREAVRALKHKKSKKRREPREASPDPYARPELEPEPERAAWQACPWGLEPDDAVLQADAPAADLLEDFPLSPIRTSLPAAHDGGRDGGSRPPRPLLRRRRPATVEASREDRPAWNASTAVEKEGKKGERGRGGGDGGGPAGLADVAGTAGHLDEDFRFVRGLRLQTMYDPTYRPPPGFVPDENRQPIINIRLRPPTKPGSASSTKCQASDTHTPDSTQTPVMPLAGLSHLDARVPARPPGGNSVQVLASVRASLDKSLHELAPEELTRRPAAGPGEAVRESMVLEKDEQRGKENVRPDTRQGQRRILGWLQKLGLNVDDEWLPKCESSVDLPRMHDGVLPTGALVRDDFFNGVLLCELAAAVEKMTNATAARSKLRFIDDGQKKRFVPQGTTTHPKCYAQVGWLSDGPADHRPEPWLLQVLKNVEIALEVFRRIPREIDGRHLFSSARIARGDEGVSHSIRLLPPASGDPVLPRRRSSGSFWATFMTRITRRTPRAHGRIDQSRTPRPECTGVGTAPRPPQRQPRTCAPLPRP